MKASYFGSNTTILVISTLIIFLFTGCSCDHQWIDATCLSPAVCKLCGESTGEALGHKWEVATCTTPKLCTVCKLSEGEAHGHKWSAPTCTVPKTCTLCKATEGEPNGHSWNDATCTEPKTCNVCNLTEGEAIGHILTDAIQIKDPTCFETGVVERSCTTCGETFTLDIPVLHNPGEWDIAIEATYYESGQKELSCNVCGKVLDNEPYALTDEEKENWYKKSCKVIPYKDIARAPDEYIGKLAKITGRISYIHQEAKFEQDYSVYYVYTKRYYEPFYVYIQNFGDNRLLENDTVTFYGELDGLCTEEYYDSEPVLIAHYYKIKD